jgi:hypothetical protein
MLLLVLMRNSHTFPLGRPCNQYSSTAEIGRVGLGRPSHPYKEPWPLLPSSRRDCGRRRRRSMRRTRRKLRKCTSKTCAASASKHSRTSKRHRTSTCRIWRHNIGKTCSNSRYHTHTSFHTHTQVHTASHTCTHTSTYAHALLHTHTHSHMRTYHHTHSTPTPIPCTHK